MIEGFATETAPLTAEELELVPVFVKGFSDKHGAARAITSQQIIKALAAKGRNMSGARVRKVVNYIRIHHLVRNLIASSAGYYIEEDPEKVAAYARGLLDRAGAILAVANSYKDCL